MRPCAESENLGDTNAGQQRLGQCRALAAVQGRPAIDLVRFAAVAEVQGQRFTGVGEEITDCSVGLFEVLGM